jgi:hypothetical protein
MYLAAWQLRYLTIGMNVLIAIAILGTIILGALGHREAWVDGCILVSVLCGYNVLATINHLTVNFLWLTPDNLLAMWYHRWPSFSLSNNLKHGAA